MARQRLLWGRNVHAVATAGLSLEGEESHSHVGVEGRAHLIAVSPQHVELGPLRFLAWLQPSHFDGMHQTRHHLGFPARGNEAALWLHHIIQRMNHRLPGEEVNVRLGERGGREERVNMLTCSSSLPVLTSYWS